jgi:hypothetical protein
MPARLVCGLKCPLLQGSPVPVTLLEHLSRRHGRMSSCVGIAAKLITFGVRNYSSAPHNVEEIQAIGPPPAKPAEVAVLARAPAECLQASTAVLGKR